MTDRNNRIIFKGNPFPNGHLIKKFTWDGELDPDKGLIFHLHLETDDYYAEDNNNEEEDDDDLPDWLSKTVWNNYHNCTLASKERYQEGIVVATPDQKFDFRQLDGLTLTADPLPLVDDWEPDDLAFGIYLLGHDTCADHTIKITHAGAERFDIHWTGKIALTYAGEEEFKYTFEANVTQVPFDGFHYPQEYTQEEAMELLSTLVTDPDNYIFEDLNPKSFKREYKLVRKA